MRITVAASFHHPTEVFAKAAADVNIQVAGGLVQEEYLRLEGQGPSKGHPLKLPSGERSHVGPGQMGDSRQLERPTDLLFDLGRGSLRKRRPKRMLSSTEP